MLLEQFVGKTQEHFFIGMCFHFTCLESGTINTWFHYFWYCNLGGLFWLGQRKTLVKLHLLFGNWSLKPLFTQPKSRGTIFSTRRRRSTIQSSGRLISWCGTLSLLDDTSASSQTSCNRKFSNTILFFSKEAKYRHDFL